MKQKTLSKFISHLEKQIEEGITKEKYGEKYDLANSYFTVTYQRAKTAGLVDEQLEELYNKSNAITTKKLESAGQGEDENKVEINFNRGENGLIKSYSFKIYIRNKSPLVGTFSRDEMNMVYRLYSAYGSRLTQREVSRFFLEYSLIDFKRILRAFNITKASSQFAPHVIEEAESQDKLLEMAFREKENNFLRELETEQVRKNQQLVKEYFNKIQKLESNQSRIDEIVEKFFDIDLTAPRLKRTPSTQPETDTMVIHLADLHVGAKVNPESLFDNEYNVDVIRGRLQNLAAKLIDIKPDKLIINLLGDMLDGFDNTTSRGGNIIPQNMNNFEQVNNYLQVMDEFFVTLLDNFNPNQIYVYSVPSGNHCGAGEYTATKALLYKLEFKYGISSTLFEQFFGWYQIGDHKWVLTHGKDSEFAKRGLPLNLDDRTKVMIYDWLDEQDIRGKNIHFIKGDLHNDNINSSYKLDYRNVLSLFGASDYSMLNFQRSNYGVSYDILSGDIFARGAFTDLLNMKTIIAEFKDYIGVFYAQDVYLNRCTLINKYSNKDAYIKIDEDGISIFVIFNKSNPKVEFYVPNSSIQHYVKYTLDFDEVFNIMNDDLPF